MSWPQPPMTDEEREAHGAAGARIRTLRQHLRMSQGELGAVTTLSAAHIGRLERGQRRWRESTLDRCIDALTTKKERPAVRAELHGILSDVFAEESEFAERVERRRRRREWARRGDTAKTLRDTAALNRKMAKYSTGERAESLGAIADKLLADAARIMGEPMPDADVELSQAERHDLAAEELKTLERELPSRKWSNTQWRAHFDRLDELRAIVAEGRGEDDAA